MSTITKSNSIHFDAAKKTLYNLLNSQVFHYPFPHWYIKDIFSYDFFLKIRAHLPEKKNYKNIIKDEIVPYSKITANEAYRYIFYVSKKNLNKIDEEKSIFWNKFIEEFSNVFFLNSILNFIQPHLEPDFYKALIKKPLMPSWQLFKDYSNYSILPHTDIQEKVFSLLFYLPSSDQTPQHGTDLYLPKIESFLKKPSLKDKYKTDSRIELKYFHKLKTLPYIPNSAFGFIRSNYSFHGVEPLKEKNTERDILCLTLIS